MFLQCRAQKMDVVVWKKTMDTILWGVSWEGKGARWLRIYRLLFWNRILHIFEKKNKINDSKTLVYHLYFLHLSIDFDVMLFQVIFLFIQSYNFNSCVFRICFCCGRRIFWCAIVIYRTVGDVQSSRNMPDMPDMSGRLLLMSGRGLQHCRTFCPAGFNIRKMSHKGDKNVWHKT